MFHSEFQNGIQRRLESQKEKKRNKKNLNPPEGFCITFRTLKGNSNLAQAEKEDKRKEPKEIGLYSSSFKLKRRKKKERSRKKVGFYNINLYFRGIFSFRKRITNSNNYTSLRCHYLFYRERSQLTKKKTLLEKLSRRRKKNREWLFIKRKSYILSCWYLWYECCGREMRMQNKERIDTHNNTVMML